MDRIQNKLIYVAAILGVVFGCLANANASTQLRAFEESPINYQKAEVNDAVAKLIKRLGAGDVKLAFDEEHGYLKSLLNQLDIPVSSQTLVFSKTSLQVRKISPRRPRALYFNDDVYVGWCRNGDMIEMIATDAKEGPTFYSIDQKPQEQPVIKRDSGRCMSCHISNRTQRVPGFVMRSVYSNDLGHPDFRRGTFNTDMASPFEERWGGWYVTGTHGDMRHMGNQIFENSSDPRSKRVEKVDLETGANRLSLDGLISTKKYLSNHSDIVALMVLQHQTQMHNAITFANFETRRALDQSYSMNKILERPESFISESANRRINAATERVVEHLLMCGEYELTDQVAGLSGFAEEFSAKGKRDSQGRSLRDFDLKKRLFRYPCSYYIYSESFEGLPDEVRFRVLKRLKAVLDGEDADEKFSHLDTATCRAILEILKETKQGF